MNTPSCRNCRTDAYLRYLDYTPARTRTLNLRSQQAQFTRERVDDPVSDYFCRKCGLRDGRSVPIDWEQPDETIADDAILEEFGGVFTAPGLRKGRDGWLRGG